MKQQPEDQKDSKQNSRKNSQDVSIKKEKSSQQQQNKTPSSGAKKQNDGKPNRIDYRVKAYKQVLDCVRTGKQFVMQKLIRRVKENNKQQGSKQQKDEKQDVSELPEEIQKKSGKQERKLKNRQKNLEKKIQSIKALETLDQKLMALHILEHIVGIDYTKENEYFEEHVCEGFQKRIEEEVTEPSKKSPEESFIAFFIEQIKETSKFKTTQGSLTSTKEYIQKQLDRSKKIREKKKEKFQLKKQNKGEAQVQNPPNEEKVAKKLLKKNKGKKTEDDSDEEEVDEKKVTKRISKAMSDKQKKRLQQWQSDKDKQPVARTEFKKKGKDSKQSEKLKKNVERRIHFTEKNKQQQPTGAVADGANIHPSWAAKQEQKKKEANINVFAGSKKKL